MRNLPGAFWASAAGIAYGGLLAVLAFTLPVYSTDTSSVGSGTATLVDENDLGAVVLLPLVDAASAFALLNLV